MQRVYSSNYPMSAGRKSALFKRSKNRDYLIRSEKRSPYDTGSIARPKPDDGKLRKPKRGIGYMALTLLILVIAYPAGLCMLWSRRLKWRLAPKMLLTIITACAFCLLAIYAINVDTGNVKITAAQKDARAALMRVNEYTGDWVDGALAWFSGIYAEGADNAALIWDAVKRPLATEGLKLYSKVEGNLNAMKRDMPALLLAEYKTRIDYVEPEPKPVSEGAQTALLSAITPPAAAPDKSNAGLPDTSADAPSEPLNNGLATVSEAPQPPAITLPALKNAGYAPIYFTPNGVRYHMTTNCSGMMNAVSHTLKEAEEANKAPCDVCRTPSFSMIDCDELMWVDVRNIAHTTDECPEFDGDFYKLLPFDEVHGSVFSYCAACGGDICERYIMQNVLKYTTDAVELDENTRKLYNYEKSLTVYYMANYRYYHADMKCDNFMTGNFVHSLYEALHVHGLSPCVKCAPLTEEDILDGGLHQLNNA